MGVAAARETKHDVDAIAAALRERDRSQAFLIDWTDALRWAEDPDAIMDLTLERLGRHLGATRVTYAEFDEATRTFTTKWNWAHGCRSLIGLQVRLADVGPKVEQEWLEGRVVRYDDVSRDARADARARTIYADRQIAAFVSVPLVRGPAVRAILSVQSDRPRRWQDGEIGLIRDVGERSWATLERARAQAELRARDRDQRFVIDWLDDVRGETAPDAILQRTMSRLGTHLGAARAAYSRLELAGGAYTIVSEWRGAGPPTLGLSYPASNLSDAVRTSYLAGEAMVSDDLTADPRFSAIARERFAENGVVARIGMPLTREDEVRAVLSIDSDRPRRWAAAEIRLVRDIAERMWVLLHRAQAEAELKERERNQAFLIGWSDDVRTVGSPRAVLSTTLAALGEHLDVNRANYAEAAPGGDSLEVLQEWRDGAVSVLGQRFPLAAFGQRVLDSHFTSDAVVIDAVATDARFDAANRPLYEGIGVGAFVSIPLIRAGEIEAVLSVQSDTPRRWTPAEIRLLRDVADRTWAVLERARTEERLAESEALLTAFMENAPLGMHLKDAHGRYLRMNPELSRQIAIPVERVVGRLPSDFLQPETAARVVELERRALEGEVASAEFLFPGRTDYTALLAVVFPIAGPRGVARTGGFTLDLSARKAAEDALRKSRDALHQSEKLTALGSLLAGVSHELNNPLSIVVAQAVMMERQAKGTELADRAVKIRRAADRCARIVQTFLAMARQKRPERAAVALNAVVDAALELAGYGLRTDGVAIERRLAPDLPVIAADADQLHQIVVNLLVNAQHALQGWAGERAVSIATGLGPEPDTVVLDIADTGPGVPDAVARRMFEPFFTTKEQGEGTGLGLSFSQGLAEAHGGRLVLVSGEGGARFRLTLPVDADRTLPRVAPPDPPAAAPPPPRRRALLVDDESEIAEALADFLGLEGYACDLATSGAEACRFLAAGEYDLIVSDLRMPTMDGPALHACIARDHPAMLDRLGFVTGDTLGSGVARFLMESGRPVLEKPFTPETVARFVRAVRSTWSS